MENEKEIKKSWFTVGIAAFILLTFIFFIAMVVSFIGMLIDNQCYQLEPNQFYNHTICEKYWKIEN